MEIVDASNIAAPEPVHESRRAIGAGRRQQEVDVIGHQDIGVDRAADIGGDLGEIVEIGAPIGIVEEASLAIDAALHEMDRHAGDHEAWPAWHGRMFCRRPTMTRVRTRVTSAGVGLTTGGMRSRRRTKRRWLCDRVAAKARQYPRWIA